jgi:hypothetical protein
MNPPAGMQPRELLGDQVECLQGCQRHCDVVTLSCQCDIVWQVSGIANTPILPTVDERLSNQQCRERDNGGTDASVPLQRGHRRHAYVCTGKADTHARCSD